MQVRRVLGRAAVLVAFGIAGSSFFSMAAGGSAATTHTVDVSKSGDVSSYYVFRNGHFRLLQVHYFTYALQDTTGHVFGYKEVEDSSDFKLQLGKLSARDPIDQTKANLSPSQVQQDEITAIVGDKPTLPGQPRRVMTEPKL